MRVFAGLVVVILAAACGGANDVATGNDAASLQEIGPGTVTPVAAHSGRTEKAVFAGGCFWCTEADFDKVPGVIATTSGYTGGHVADPTYNQVSAGGTGHVEAVEITYDPAVISYEQLLQVYWRSIDPFSAHGQFTDVGEQYRPAIFALTPEQEKAAKASQAAIDARVSRPTVVSIEQGSCFYVAEAEHQDYHSRNPARYGLYRRLSGRDSSLEKIWGSHP